MPEPASNILELTVSEISTALKKRVEEDFGHVRIRGEVSQPKWHTSGHLYLTLKDESACLAAVCWRGVAGRLRVKPEEGMEIIAEGRLTTYAMQSKYQLVIEQVSLAGVGALLKMLEERKKKLAAEGLFDADRKKPLPFLPEVIGVITSPTGAVIRDILHRLAERFPRRVLLWPVNVQGEGAANQIASAIAGFNAIEKGGPVPRPDVLIVARGGGSLEDLLAFHEEVVVRAAAASRIPLISAVGHETDVTLIDFAADKRAPTPTAAAEMAVPVRADLFAHIGDRANRLEGCLRHVLESRRLHLERNAGKLVHPRAMLENLAQRLDDRFEHLSLSLKSLLARGSELLHKRAAGLSLLPLKQNVRNAGQNLGNFSQRLATAHARLLEKQSERLASLGALLESYSYNGVLARGFALVRDSEGRTITRAADVKPKQDLKLTFADGTRSAVAKD
ncbi:MAG TPA: exodeoxyribonuclease VII large subunit [Alphaproteobacteria bacterium]|nr:exodeoxyribonuclease VII large subunit [Alphaproteobacteria bacterium]